MAHSRISQSLRIAAGAALALAVSTIGGSATAEPSPTPTPLTVRETTVASHGQTLFVRMVGGYDGGPTLVVLHGGPGISHDYTRPLEALATPSYRVVTFDQRGAGRSSAVADPTATKLDDYAADLEAVRATLVTRQIDLAGHSWGGLVAMAYAARQPEHVRSLMFFGSVAPTDHDRSEGKAVFRAKLERLRAAGLVPPTTPESVADDCVPRLLALQPTYYFDPAHPASKGLGGSTCRDAINRQTWAANKGYDLTAGLAPLSVPTLILQGEGDPFGPLMADAIAAALAKSGPAKVILPQCGHIPWAECPDLFFDRVRAFLAARP